MKIKFKWWFIVGIVIFFLLVGGNIFKSRAIEKKEAHVEQLKKDVIVYRNDIVKIHNDNLIIYKNNKGIKKRFDALVKEKQKIKIIVKTKTIEVNKELYVSKKLYDNLDMNYDEIVKEFNLSLANVAKLELNEIVMQTKIKGLEKTNADITDDKDDIIKIQKKKLRKRIHFGFGVGVTLAPDGSAHYGIQGGVYYKIF